MNGPRVLAELVPARSVVRRTDPGAEGLFTGWAPPGWMWVWPDGAPDSVEWRTELVEVVKW